MYKVQLQLQAASQYFSKKNKWIVCNFVKVNICELQELTAVKMLLSVNLY